MNIIYPFKTFIFFSVLLAIGFITGQEKTTKKHIFKAPLTKIGASAIFEQISFLQDSNGAEFVLKTHSDSQDAITETLGARIGKSVGININDVEPFPENSKHFKEYTPDAISIHTRVPGLPVAEIESIDDNLDIEGGLRNHKNLRSISLYAQLCDFVAVDLFCAKHDAHNYNIFFDQTTNEFHEIDMDHLLRGRLTRAANDISEDTYKHIADTELKYFILQSDLPATQACDFLETFENKRLKAQEIKALERLNKKLQQLINNYPPEKFHHEWMELADQLGCKYNPIKKENIKIAIEYNFHENKRLCSQIDTVLRSQASRMPFALRRWAKPSMQAQQAMWQTINS